MKTRCTSMPAALRCRAIRQPRRSGLRLRGSSHSSVFIAPVNPTGVESVASENLSGKTDRNGSVVPNKRTTTPSERIFAATRRDGAHFPDLIVAGRYNSPGIRHSPLLHLSKMGSRCSHPVGSLTDPGTPVAKKRAGWTETAQPALRDEHTSEGVLQ